MRSTCAASRRAQDAGTQALFCCPSSRAQACLQAKEAADKEKADEASGKAAGEADDEPGETPAPAEPPATEDAIKQQAEAEGKTVEVQPEQPADAAPDTGACCLCDQQCQAQRDGCL